MSDQDIFLRPEAQPVRYWVQLSPDHRQALDRLTDQLNAAVLRLDQTNNGHPTSPSWLFHETRTQLAFLDGTRGSGKTSLMSTLVARLTDPSALQFAPTNTKKDPVNSSEDPQYKSVSEKLKKLHGRVICVQPLDMEPLPRGTSLFAAILARVQRALQEKSNPTLSRGLLDGDFGETRDGVRLRQFTERIAKALDSNLHERRGSLDPENYADEVLILEESRLQLPQVLDEVLRQLTTCSGQNNSKELRKLFLVPIDDVDLNPQHCLELLQLLRTFSPPQELFFLLMGQYELVQRCVELKMASQYAQLHKAADTLSDPDCGTLRQEVRRVAILNLRKMVPPHALCEIPARLNLQAAIDFRPIVTPVDKPPEDIGELLWKIEIRTSRGDVHHRFSTLGHLLLSPYRQPTRTETIGALEACAWTQYCGPQVLRVSYRRLVDLWMELKQKNDIRSLFHFLDRSLSLDTQITGNELNRLRSGNNQYCSLRLNEAPEFELSLHVEVEDPVREVDGGLTRTNIRQKRYGARLQLAKPVTGSGIPVFTRAQRDGAARSNGSQPVAADATDSRADMYCEETCSVLAVLHDLKSIIDESPITAGPLRDFTSERPVRLSWWGTEGEVASFMWPLPPLQTYVETSAFLGLWHECLQAFLGNPSSTPVPDRSEGGAELRLFELQMVQLAKRCGERCHGKQPGISSRISSEVILELTQLWIVLGTYEVLRCTEPQDLDLKSAAGDGTMSSEASFSGLLQFSLESLQVSQSQISKTQIYRSQRILNEWICRILQLLQPEHVTPEIAGRFFLGLSVSTQQWLQQELDSVRRAVSGQRRLRLLDIWKSGKRELWKQLNTVQGEQPLLILLDVPEAYTKKDMRTDVKELRLMMEQMKAAQQFESARQELRTQLAFAEMQAATDVERALESYQAALERARALAKDRSGNVEFLDEFVTLAFKIIDVLRGRRNWSAIEAIYPGLLSFWKETLKSSGSDNSRQRAIWQRAILLTDIARHLEQWRAAATLSQESLEICRQLHKEAPENTQAQRDLSISLVRCGDVALKREDLVAADQFFRESLRIDRKLHEKAPDSEQAQRYLSISLDRCGDVALKREDLVAADQFFRESLRIDRKLHENAPDSEQAQRALSISLGRCGDVALKREDWVAADQFFSESLNIRRKLHEKAPDSGEAKRNLSGALQQQAVVLEHKKDMDLAEANLRHSLELLQALMTAAPDLIAPRIDVVDVSLELAGLLIRAGKTAVARELLESDELLRAIEVLRARDPKSDRIRVLLGILAFRQAYIVTHPRMRRSYLKEAEEVFNDASLIPIIQSEYGFRTAAAEFANRKVSRKPR